MNFKVDLQLPVAQEQRLEEIRDQQRVTGVEEHTLQPPLHEWTHNATPHGALSALQVRGQPDVVGGNHGHAHQVPLGGAGEAQTWRSRGHLLQTRFSRHLVLIEKVLHVLCYIYRSTAPPSG